jgi:hypothetical protein
VAVTKRTVAVDVLDDDEAVRTILQLVAMLNAGSHVVLLRRPDLPAEMWNEVSPLLVARASAALHGQPVEAPAPE